MNKCLFLSHYIVVTSVIISLKSFRQRFFFFHHHRKNFHTDTLTLRPGRRGDGEEEELGRAQTQTQKYCKTDEEDAN